MVLLACKVRLWVLAVAFASSSSFERAATHTHIATHSVFGLVRGGSKGGNASGQAFGRRTHSINMQRAQAKVSELKPRQKGGGRELRPWLRAGCLLPTPAFEVARLANKFSLSLSPLSLLSLSPWLASFVRGPA